jgi:AsmA protein
MGVSLDDGLLATELREVSLYGGMGRGTLVVDAREATPTFRQTLNVTSTRIEPFLIDLMAMDRLSGTASIALDLSSRGATVDDMVNALSGSAQFNVADGALRGIDIASVARMLQNVVNASGLGEVTGDGAATEFTDMGGTFRVQNGIAYNDDFELLNPLIRVRGNGEINLAARTMDFLLDPEPAPGGSVGGMALGNLGVPFRVHGPWTDLSYTPDMRGVAEGVLGGLGGLFGGGQDTDNTPEDGAPANPLENAGDALRSLFGLGGR